MNQNGLSVNASNAAVRLMQKQDKNAGKSGLLVMYVSPQRVRESWFLLSRLVPMEAMIYRFGRRGTEAGRSFLFDQDCHEEPLVSTPEAVMTPVESMLDGIVMGSPRACAVRMISSLSMRSYVVLQSSSTSALVRPVVGIGSRTVEEGKSHVSKKKKVGGEQGEPKTYP